MTDESRKISSRDMNVARWADLGKLYGCPLQIGLPEVGGEEILKRVNELLFKSFVPKIKTNEELDKELEEIINKL